MNKFFLFLVMLPAALWRNMGADTIQLKAILGAKLKIDDRKPLSFGRRRKTKNGRFNGVMNLVVYFFIGFIYSLPLTFKDQVLALFGYYTTFLFFLSFSLITDFANLVTDTKDKMILLPKPINDQTLLLSRFLHVSVYLFRIILPMSLSGWIILGIDKGWKAAVLFPVPLFMMLLMALFFVNACYLIILKFVKAERFQNVINSFQIAFSVFVIIFFYIIQGVMKSTAIQNLDPANISWIKYTPPYWLAACWSWIGIKTTIPHTSLYSILAVVVPVACLWLTITKLAPSFARKLGSIDGVEGAKSFTKNSIWGRSYKSLANIFNNNDAAKAGFIITWLQTSRSRTFKMRVYPALVYIPVYFFYLLLMSDKPLRQVWRELPETKHFLILLYMSAFALMQAMNYVTMSDQYKAAWIYYSSPLEKPGGVMIGAFKALWLKYYLPFITLIGVFVLYVWGISFWIDVLLAATNVTLFTLCIMRIGIRAFPFSMMEQMKNSGGKTIIRIFSTFILIGVLGFSHYLAYFFWLKLLFLVLSALFLWLVWDSYKNTDWNDLKTAEDI